jgi:hypothetical protein
MAASDGSDTPGSLNHRLLLLRGEAVDLGEVLQSRSPDQRKRRLGPIPHPGMLSTAAESPMTSTICSGSTPGFRRAKVGRSFSSDPKWWRLATNTKPCRRRHYDRMPCRHRRERFVRSSAS